MKKKKFTGLLMITGVLLFSALWIRQELSQNPKTNDKESSPSKKTSSKEGIQTAPIQKRYIKTLPDQLPNLQKRLPVQNLLNLPLKVRKLQMRSLNGYMANPIRQTVQFPEKNFGICQFLIMDLTVKSTLEKWL